MNGDIKISKKSALFLSLSIACYAFADYVSIIDLESSGGISITSGVTEESLQEALDELTLDYETKIAALKTNVMDELPIGTVAMWGTSTPPDGWLAMNGQSTSGYTDLASIYGSSLPDLRGEFIRGWDDSRGIDSGRSLLSYQAGTKIAGENGTDSSMNTHTIHNINDVHADPIYESDFNYRIQYDTETGNQHYSDSTIWWKTVRPRNISLMYIVKATNTEN